MEVSWDAAKGAIAYEAQWRQNNGNWINVPRSGANNFSITGIYAGRYQVRVRAISPSDVYSLWANSAEVQLTGKEGAPPALASFKATGIVFGITLDWLFPKGAEDTQKTEVWSNATNSDDGAMHYGDYAYPQRSHTVPGLAAGKVLWFKARIVDRLGNVGPWSQWTRGMASDDAGLILDYIAGQIEETQLGKALREKINSAITEANLKDIEKQIETVRDQLGADAAALDKQLADASERLDSLAKAALENSLGLQQEKQERGEREAWIIDRQNILETDTESIAEHVTQLGANFDGQQATLTTLEKTVSNNQQATATSLKQLESRTETSEGAIKDLRQTVATDSKAKAEQLSKLNTKVGENAAGITGLKQSQSDLEGSQAQIVQGLEANAKATIQNSLNQVEGEQRQAAVSATLKTTQEVIANQQEAHAKQLTTLTANFDTASASLTRLDETVAREKEATSRALRDMSSQVGENKSSITQEAKTRADADKTLGERITQVRSETKESLAQALDQVKTVSEAQQASASRIQSLEASAIIDNTPEGLLEQALGLHEQGKERRKAEAKIIHEQTVIANQQEAVAKEQTTLKAQMGENTAQLQQVSEVQANVNGKLLSMHTIKTEVTANGETYVAGIALGVDGEGNSQFLVDANRFAAINRANGQVSVPFVVQNGQVFMNQALIADGSIDAAKIKRASIGAGQITDYLTSDNFIPGTQGLMINFRTGELQLNGNVPGIGRRSLTNLRDDYYDGGNHLVVRIGKLRG